MEIRRHSAESMSAQGRSLYSLGLALRRLYKGLSTLTELHVFHKHSFLLLPKFCESQTMSCVCLSVSEMTRRQQNDWQLRECVFKNH